MTSLEDKLAQFINLIIDEGRESFPIEGYNLAIEHWQLKGYWRIDAKDITMLYHPGKGPNNKSLVEYMFAIRKEEDKIVIANFHRLSYIKRHGYGRESLSEIEKAASVLAHIRKTPVEIRFRVFQDEVQFWLDSLGYQYQGEVPSYVLSLPSLRVYIKKFNFF
ncbi:MAG: hypothetical protein V1859_10860 [archaeon]